jgi:hypothetical protein
LIAQRDGTAHECATLNLQPVAAQSMCLVSRESQSWPPLRDGRASPILNQ